ncbi:1-deoxy-D-xylulose-5-phosphate synthase [Dionaea muscipula]
MEDGEEITARREYPLVIVFLAAAGRNAVAEAAARRSGAGGRTPPAVARTAPPPLAQIYSSVASPSCVNNFPFLFSAPPPLPLPLLRLGRHSLHLKPEGYPTPINAVSTTLSKLQSSKPFRKLREVAKGLTKRFGKGLHEWIAKVDEYARGMMGPAAGSTLFEELGLYYIGPVNGNKIEDMICVLQEVSSLDSMGPVLIHVLTNEKQITEDERKNEIAENISGGNLSFY